RLVLFVAEHEVDVGVQQDLVLAQHRFDAHDLAVLGPGGRGRQEQDAEGQEDQEAWHALAAVERTVTNSRSIVEHAPKRKPGPAWTGMGQPAGTGSGPGSCVLCSRA